MNNLVNKSISEKLDYLIIVGGISTDYRVTVRFIEELGLALKDNDIKLRFIFGNTDLYYKDDVIDKEKKVNEIMSMYRRSPYYLPNNSIITRNVRIVGAETWYDYSLYRGKPKDFKDISKKKILMFKANDDNRYITNESDYSLGLKNVYDIRYSRLCASLMKNRIEFDRRRHGDCSYNVVVTYFKSSKSLLGMSLIDKYMGAFEGSSVYHDICKENNVTDYIFGSYTPKKRIVILDNIRYLGVSKKMEVVEFGY